jgi:hypothetical protein
LAADRLNRTPDSLFQGLCTTPTACSTRPGPLHYNIQTTAWLDNSSRTGTTNPTAVQFGLGYDLRHNHAAFVTICDLNSPGVCAMDGAANASCRAVSQPCPTKPAFGYVDNSAGAVQGYLDLVKAYGWANYMFQTNQGLATRRINSCLERHRLRQPMTTTRAFSQRRTAQARLPDVPTR